MRISELLLLLLPRPFLHGYTKGYSVSLDKMDAAFSYTVLTLVHLTGDPSLNLDGRFGLRGSRMSVTTDEQILPLETHLGRRDSSDE